MVVCRKISERDLHAVWWLFVSSSPKMTLIVPQFVIRIVYHSNDNPVSDLSVAKSDQ